jgi:hypothetical protein
MVLETIAEGKARAKLTEYLVADVFRSYGYEVTHASKRDEIENDIDLIVRRNDKRMTVSVKNQAAGLRYGHIYAEIWEGFSSPVDGRQSIGHAHTYIDGVRYDLTKYDGWLRFGSADLYAIVQGTELVLVKKKRFECLVNKELHSGRANLKYLSERYRRRALESGHPALTNQSIYLDRDSVKAIGQVVDLTLKKKETA